MSVHVAIMAVVGPGETLVMARNGHKSSFAGLVLSGARPVYLDPYYDEELEIALGPLAGDLVTVLDGHPEARAALVFTPSYYGTSRTSARWQKPATSGRFRWSPTTPGALTTRSVTTRSCRRAL
jgi:arginine/lysine/ornithine decarboxylase